MRNNKSPHVARWIIALSLAFSLCCGIFISDNHLIEQQLRVEASSGEGHDSGRANGADKMSPDLRGKSASAELVRVILQLNGKPSGRLNALLNRSGVHVRAELDRLDTLALDLPLGVVEELSSFGEVDF